MRQQYEDFDERFTFVRNPWARLIFWYSGHLKWNISLYKSMPFDEWALKKYQQHFIYNKQGRCLVGVVWLIRCASSKISKKIYHLH